MSAANDPRTRDLQPWFTTLLDVVACHRLEIVVPLNEHERAGLMFESWPAQVRNYVMRYLKEWTEQNPAREIVATTYAVVEDDGGDCCTVIAHHSEKTAKRKRKPKPAPAPAGGPAPSAAPACATCSE